MSHRLPRLLKSPGDRDPSKPLEVIKMQITRSVEGVLQKKIDRHRVEAVQSAIRALSRARSVDPRFLSTPLGMRYFNLLPVKVDLDILKHQVVALDLSKTVDVLLGEEVLVQQHQVSDIRFHQVIILRINETGHRPTIKLILIILLLWVDTFRRAVLDAAVV